MFEIEEFPQLKIKEKVRAAFQDMLSSEDAAPVTEFEMERPIAELEASLLRCLHEIRVYKPGRAKQITFEYFTLKENFVAYYFPAKKLMVVKARRDAAEGAMRQMFKDDRVKGKQNVIDLHSIHNRLEEIKGIYATVEGNIDVSTVALFGKSVDTDDRFIKAMNEGKMYFARTMYTFEGTPILVGLSERCGVVIHDATLDEQRELRLVLEIKERIFDQAKPKN